MFQKLTKTAHQVPWWFLLIFIGAMSFAYATVGPVEEEPEGNFVLGGLLFVGLATSLLKLFFKPQTPQK